ncbi:carboxypeptidase-like regulatory domain-containing protein [Cystobacter fuscus]|nr:carboxypeptidase-like regulatory domain-containing protein [Cystobacter fuscus]
MKKHWAVVLPLLVLACGPKDENGDGIADGVRDPDSVSVVAPANPKGTVSGQVLDTAMQPLAGASIRLTIGSDTAEGKYVVQTDGLGNFMIKNVPAGSTVLVTIAKEGYATLRASAVVPSSAGNIPINDGNASLGLVMLAKTQSKVSFTLLTDKGQPAVGAQAFLEAYPAGLISAAGTTVQATSTVTATPAVADAMGVVTFNNVPSPSELTRIGTPVTGSTTPDGTASYRLWVDPVDVNGDGVIDSGGYAAPISAAVLLKSGSQIITLNPAKNSGGSTTFSLVATNVPSLQLTPVSPAEARKPLRNLLRPGEPIVLGFSQPVARDSLIAILTSESGQTAIDLTVTPNETGDVYMLTPAANSTLEGQEYNLILRATSAYSGAMQTWKGYFVSGDVKTPRPLQLESVTFRDGATGTAGVLDPGECIILTFNQVVTSTSFQLDAFLLNGTDSKPVKPQPAPYPSGVTACFGSEGTKIPIDTVSFQATPRFYFTYGTPAEPNLPPINPNSTTARIRVDFSKFQQQDFSLYYETAWGAPVPSTTVLEKVLTPPVR